MSDRLVTVVTAILALFVFGGVLLRGQGPPAPPASRPSSQDTGEAGLLGLHRWLESSGIHVERLRERYDRLDDLPVAKTGNLLVLTTIALHRPRSPELGALKEWVSGGNHVLLLTPGAEGGGRRVAGRSFNGSTIEWQLDLQRHWRAPREFKDGKASDELEPSPFTACAGADVNWGTITGPLRRLRPYPPERAHPVLEGVKEVAVKADSFGRAGWLAPSGGWRMFRPLLCEPVLQQPVFTEFRLGGGRVWASDFTGPFSNDNLGRADNARLLSNLVAFAVGHGGAVIFDDMHQGDSVLYDPDAFFKDPRLHGTLLFLFVGWLLWLLADTGRFALPLRESPGPAGADFVRAQAQFLRRHLRRGETALSLLARFVERERRRRGIAGTAVDLWNQLSLDPRLDPARVAELRELDERARLGRRIDTVRLRNLILDLEKLTS